MEAVGIVGKIQLINLLRFVSRFFLSHLFSHLCFVLGDVIIFAAEDTEPRAKIKKKERIKRNKRTRNSPPVVGRNPELSITDAEGRELLVASRWLQDDCGHVQLISWFWIIIAGLLSEWQRCTQWDERRRPRRREHGAPPHPPPTHPPTRVPQRINNLMPCRRICRLCISIAFQCSNNVNVRVSSGEAAQLGFIAGNNEIERAIHFRQFANGKWINPDALTKNSSSLEQCVPLGSPDLNWWRIACVERSSMVKVQANWNGTGFFWLFH